MIVSCDTCEKSITKPPSLVRDHNFCGDACYRKWRKTRTGELNSHWKGGNINLVCPICGKTFFIQPGERGRKYCSIECKTISQTKVRVCKQCRNTFTGQARTFCSFGCFLSYYREHPITRSEETKAKNSKSHKGLLGLTGKDNPMFLDGYSANIEKTCLHCGIKFIGPSYRKYCSRQCSYAELGNTLHHFYVDTPEGKEIVERYTEEMKSLGNPAWIHEEYAPGFTSALKRRILRRDNFSCRICGSLKLKSRWLVIHHIDGSKTNHDPKNLITLCKACHMHIHKNNIDASIFMVS